MGAVTWKELKYTATQKTVAQKGYVTSTLLAYNVLISHSITVVVPCPCQGAIDTNLKVAFGQDCMSCHLKMVAKAGCQ